MMIYIKRLKSQDIEKGHQYNLSIESVRSFFNLKLEKGEDSDLFKNLHDKNNPSHQFSTTVISRRANRNGEEYFFYGDLKPYLSEKYGADIGDLIVFTKKKDNSYSFEFIKEHEIYTELFISVLFPSSRENHIDIITDIDEKNEDNATEYNDESVDQNVCFPVQQIYFGSPGSGKSYIVNNKIKKTKNYRVTFHPDTDYASFVGCYKPAMSKDEDGKEIITYNFVEETFLTSYKAAWESFLSESPETVYLVIEELSRGNCAQIFGDIFQLLDRNNKGFSEYPIRAEHDVEVFFTEKWEEDSFITKYKKAINENVSHDDSEDFDSNDFNLCLPPNLSLLATMNTSDQSVFPMDSAFKRRWDWIYIPINEKDAESLIVEVNDKISFKWSDFIKKINAQISEDCKSDDKKIGNRFVKAIDGKISLEQFTYKVLFYLWSEIYKDFYKTHRNIFREKKDSDGFAYSDLFTIVGDSKENTVEINVTKVIAFLEANDIQITKGASEDNVPK